MAEKHIQAYKDYVKGDAEKGLSLIDAYDRTLSDVSNEIEQCGLAYLILKGLGADEDTHSSNLKRLEFLSFTMKKTM